MSISITIHAESGAEARAQMRELLGHAGSTVTYDKNDPDFQESVKNDDGLRVYKGDDPLPESVTNAVSEIPTTFTQRIQGVRERGQPSPGKARRTKAEIAEDEAADKRGAEIAERVADDTQHAEIMAAGRAAISTGEERVGPEDDTATVEQDEADEAAETAAAVEERPADKKLTHDDVRNSLGAYVKLYGMAAAQEDGPKVIAMALKNPEIVKVSAIPETQEALGAVVAGIDEMTDKNPFKRAKVA